MSENNISITLVECLTDEDYNDIWDGAHNGDDISWLYYGEGASSLYYWLRSDWPNHPHDIKLLNFHFRGKTQDVVICYHA